MASAKNEQAYAHYLVNYLAHVYVGVDYSLIDEEGNLQQERVDKVHQMREDVKERITTAELRQWIREEDQRNKATSKAFDEIGKYLDDPERVWKIIEKMGSFFREIDCWIEYAEGVPKIVRPRPSEEEKKKLASDLINFAVQTLTNLDEPEKRLVLSYFEDPNLDDEGLRNRIVQELTTPEIRDWLNAK